MNEAHAAVARRAEFWVVAIVRDDGADATASFDHPHALRELVPDTVNLHIDQTFCSRKVFRQSGFRWGRRCIAHD